MTTAPTLRLVDATRPDATDTAPVVCCSHYTPADRRAWDEALRGAGWERTAVVGGRGWYRNARFPNDQNELGWTAPTALMMAGLGRLAAGPQEGVG
jgi:hypothetical protein